jgi:hypothetical protein
MTAKTMVSKNAKRIVFAVDSTTSDMKLKKATHAEEPEGWL